MKKFTSAIFTKKIIVLIGALLLLLQFNTKAQEYLPFPQDSAVWYSVKSWPEPFPPPPVYYDTYKFEANGDTLINNVEYTKFYWNGALGERPGYTGAYRIEPDSNRVYYYDTWDTCEFLAYDFNLVPQDTVIIHDMIYICLDTGSVTLNNGINHKSQIMLVPSANNCYQFWIHGVGSLGMPLLETYWGCGYTFETAYNLTCFFYKDEQISEWANPYFEGCIGSNLGVEEYLKENSFAIKPNPVTGTSHLVCNTTENTLFDYQIIDVNGNILQGALGVKPNDILIQNNRFPDGIYLLRLYSYNIKQFFSIKFIIN